MKKHLLITLGMMFGVAMSAQYFSEDFNGGTSLPSGWVATQAAGSDGWTVNTSAALSSTSFTIPSNGTNVIATNDDGCNCDASEDRIILPAIDLSSADAPYVQFDQYYLGNTYQNITEHAYLQASTNGGTNWTTVSEIAGNSVNDFQTVAYSLADYAGESNLMLSFLYDDGGGWLYGFAIDDISVIEAPAGLDLALSTFVAAPLNSYIPSLTPADMVVTGRDIYFGVTITNNSGDVINSFDVTVSNGTDEVTQHYEGLNIPWTSTYTAILEEVIPAAAGSNSYTATVSNINGGNDSNVANNTSNSDSFSGVSLHPDKAVLVEEGTGTWCGWCPRGTVMMDFMSDMYPDNFVGIAVHNGDPMTVTAYDAWLGPFIGNAYPGIFVDRDVADDPINMESMVIERAMDAPVATITHTQSLSGNQLTLNVAVTYNENLSGDYRVNAIIVEDHLTGTGNSWAQTNYYAGGGNGPMGGYESAGATVTGVTYNHVGRAWLGGEDGVESSLPASGTAGTTYNYTFNTTLDNAWNPAYIHPVTMIINASTGEVMNARMSSEPLAVNEVPTIDNTLIVYPNPSNGKVNIQCNLDNQRQGNVMVYNITGELVMSRQIQDLRMQTQLDLTDLGSGLYTVTIESEGYTATRRITVSK